MKKPVRPYVKARINVGNPATGQKFSPRDKASIFIDTGSSKTILPLEALLVLEETIGPFQKAPALVQTVKGPVMMLAVRNARLCVENCCYQGDVLVADRVPGDVLIGADFLSATKATIDFKKGSFKCDASKKRIRMGGRNGKS